MSLSPANSIVVSNGSLWSIGGVLSNEIYSLTGRQLPVRFGTPNPGDIGLTLNNSLTGEQYTYNVGSQAQISGGNYQAIAEGTATLLQSLNGSGSNITLPKVSIADQPAANAAYRAMMIDCARSYHSITDSGKRRRVVPPVQDPLHAAPPDRRPGVQLPDQRARHQRRQYHGDARRPADNPGLHGGSSFKDPGDVCQCSGRDHRSGNRDARPWRPDGLEAVGAITYALGTECSP